ncbi:MAG: response regulator [Spirochaetales bacterium]|jgi:two-component system chemotaxis response regulator CheY|nr:response regulator [Spirochaetales bacterium]
MEAIRALVIDDLPFMRGAVREVLEEAGVCVAGEAHSGKEGLRLYGRLKPDIVLLDIVLPPAGMDAFTFLRELTRFDPCARVIVSAVLGDEELVVRAIQLGARDFIVKPFVPERVVAAVWKVFNQNGRD